MWGNRGREERGKGAGQGGEQIEKAEGRKQKGRKAESREKIIREGGQGRLEEEEPS